MDNIHPFKLNLFQSFASASFEIFISNMHHPSQKVSFLRKQDSKIMLMIICKHDICRIIFVHIFGDICVCPNVYLEGVRRGSTICGKRALRASFQEKVGDLDQIYTKEKWVMFMKYTTEI